MPEWLSVEEAAQLSGYNREHLRRLIRTGKVAGERKGPMYWIDRASLQAYLDEVRALGTQRFNWRRLRQRQ